MVHTMLCLLSSIILKCPGLLSFPILRAKWAGDVDLG